MGIPRPVTRLVALLLGLALGLQSRGALLKQRTAELRTRRSMRHRGRKRQTRFVLLHKVPAATLVVGIVAAH